VNICQNETAGFVRMKTGGCDKALKTLERVKGIEPSYSAWKAAALPLSYTRALAMDYHAAHAASTADAALTVARRARLRPLTPADSLLILKASINNERR
jgi:hypothetical protein